MQQSQSSTLGASEASVASAAPALTLWRKIRFVDVLSAALCLSYLYLFWKSVSRWWFNPRWATDDALQQLFPFYSVLKPHVFEGDLIYQVMRGYLAPLHWAIGVAVTWFTQDPIMTGHFLMLLQIGLCGGFLFMAIRHAAGTAPAFIGLLFFFHTRHVIQRMTGGLPRGWATVLFAAFFYLALRRNHRAILVLILLGCLLNPPGAFLVAAAYGLLLVLRSFTKESGAEYRRHLLRLAVCAPLFVVVTLWVTHRPPEIGRMHTFEEAVTMPEFSRDGGRFSWLPFLPPIREIRAYATRTFYGRFDDPAPFWKKNILDIGIGIVGLLALIGLIRRRSVIPLEIWCFLAASLGVYALARILAFRLYVPDRHLNIPLALFWIMALTIGAWRAFHRNPEDRGDSSLRSSWGSMLGLALVGLLLYQGSGLNLSSNANFNYQDTKRGVWVPWLKKNTPETALIAGFPTFIDPVQLFSMRKAYATSETWHPFYENYNIEMKRRIDISLRAHFARTLDEFVQLTAPEKIDYFVFERRRFYPKALQNPVYFKVFQPFLKELALRPVTEFAYRELPTRVDLERYPFLVYRDNVAVIVDINKLRQFLAEKGSPANVS